MENKEQQHADEFSERSTVNHEGESRKRSESWDCCGPLMARFMERGADHAGTNDEVHAPIEETRESSCCDWMMRGTESGNGETVSCPMSMMFRGKSGKSRFGFLTVIPGLLFVLVGVAIIVEPQVLVWLLAGSSIVIGFGLMALASFLRRPAAS